MSRPTFEQSRAQYVHRYTMEHVPAWAREKTPSGYYAPQFKSDREWYETSTFPGEPEHTNGNRHCYSVPTWPLGTGWRDKPYNKD